jgi:hypothetical protein
MIRPSIPGDTGSVGSDGIPAASCIQAPYARRVPLLAGGVVAGYEPLIFPGELLLLDQKK